MDIALGVLLLLTGLGIAFMGLQVWYLLLPIWGFFVGFAIGAQILHLVFNDGFLTTVGGWIAGIALGILFALVAYLFWYAGMLLLAGSVGALLGNGLMGWLNVNTEWVITIVAIIAAILFGLAAWFLDLPNYIVIVASAFAGGAAVVTGLLMIFDKIDREDFGSGITFAVMDDKWYWSIPYFIVAMLGMIYQLRTKLEAELPDDKWVPVQTPTATAR